MRTNEPTEFSMTPKARNQTTVTSKSPKPREGWEEVFRDMAKRDDDKLLDAQTASLTRWDTDEWES